MLQPQCPTMLQPQRCVTAVHNTLDMATDQGLVQALVLRQGMHLLFVQRTHVLSRRPVHLQACGRQCGVWCACLLVRCLKPGASQMVRLTVTLATPWRYSAEVSFSKAAGCRRNRVRREGSIPWLPHASAWTALRKERPQLLQRGFGALLQQQQVAIACVWQPCVTHASTDEIPCLHSA